MNVIIVGGGQVGSYLASLLLKDGHSVKVIEMRGKQLKALQHDLPDGTVIIGEFTDPVVMETAGVAHADVVVALTPTDEANLVVSTLARFEFGVKRVIARANNPKNSWMFTPEMGVDVGLTEADLMAHVVVDELSVCAMMTLMPLQTGKHSLVEEVVHASSPAVGKPICELNLPEECVIVAVIRSGELIIPHGNTVLLAKDEVLAISPVSQVRSLAGIFGQTT